MKVFDVHKAAVCGQQQSRAGISLDLSTSKHSLGQAALITDGSVKCQQTDSSLHVRKQSA